ncbi:MAG: glycosyl hydrolase [Armatimonadetes bacterium]|nr:glycosyl hydrolase [Armatimonadota bacterium]
MKHVAILAALSAATLANAQNCRFYYAGQYDFAGKKGFYLDVEGCELSTLRFILGVADGNEWRFPAVVPPFEAGRRYDAHVEVTPENARVFLDGKLVAESPGGFMPAPGPVEVNITYPWFADIGDYLMVQESVAVTVSRDGKEVAEIERSFAKEAARPIPLQIFERGAPTQLDLKPQPGDSLTIDTTFRAESSDLVSMSPVIDRYGQNRYAEWAEKVTADDQLKADIDAEDKRLAEMPPSADYDRYGGYKASAWKEQATGFFRTVKRDGMWWLITPEGNPCFYLGVSAGPATTWETTPVSDREWLYEWLPGRDEGPWNAGWSSNQWGVPGIDYYCFQTANLIRKYGAEWQQRATEQHNRRLQTFGFSGAGKWGGVAGRVRVPVIGRGATPNVAGHPDVFDANVLATFRAELEKQIAPDREDPFILGWSLGNEYGEIITRNEVHAVLQMGADVPAKRALIDHVVQDTYGGSAERAAAAWKVRTTTLAGLYATQPTLPPEDLEKARLLYADRYYSFIYRTVKEIDPNHLYLGFWIVPGWWESEEDWRVSAPYCDVIGYDRYSRDYGGELLRRLQKETGKPTLCGEFSIPAWYGGLRGFGRYPTWAETDAESGGFYQGWVRGATADPYCVGLIWFFYRDQPLTGRGPGRGPQPVYGEHYAFGLVTGTDRVKWDLCTRMREINLQAARLRLGAGK